MLEQKHKGYLEYAVTNCLLALDELEMTNAELLQKFNEHKPISINRTGSLNRIVQDYLIVRVSGLFDKDTRTISFFDEFKDNDQYKKIRESDIIEYLIEMRNKSVAHKDREHLYVFPVASQILHSNLRDLLQDLLNLLK